MITDKEIDDILFAHHLVRCDLTPEDLSLLIDEMEWKKNGGAVLDGVLAVGRLNKLRFQRMGGLYSTDQEKIRKMIARCQWTFAKTMPWCPHEYIVRGKSPLTEEEFLYFIEMQRSYGKVERWGRYITPYLYIDDYKYWTMGAPVEETLVMNRAKVENKK